jgi:cytosine/adenosine deaminase-related metal-dependent hydrolase
MIHLAEGTDAQAQIELDQLAAANALHSNTVLIHGVGLTSSQRAAAISRGAGLVWCPSSNLFLLNAFASVADFSRAQLLAVGSDSRLTGERDLLDELQVARTSNQVPPEALLRAVTSDAATLLRVKDAGRLEIGMSADLVILPNTFSHAADALGQIRRGDLRAVIRGGTVRIADPDFSPLLPNAAVARLDNRDKIIAPDIAQQYQLSIKEPNLELFQAHSRK